VRDGQQQGESTPEGDRFFLVSGQSGVSGLVAIFQERYMLWDSVCKAVEKSGDKDWERVFRQAKLFRLEQEHIQERGAELTEDEAKFLEENFFLPFPVTAVEDESGITVIQDQEEQIGLNKVRRVWDCYDLRKSEDLVGEGASIEKGSVIISECEINVIHTTPGNPPKYEAYGDLKRIWYFRNGVGSWIDNRMADPITWEVCHTESIRNAMVALEEVKIINTPSRFVVEVLPRKMRDNPKLIPRSHERPHYVLLTPGEIKRKTGLRGQGSQNKSSGKASHPRRAHFRTLNSERFVNKRGTKILIPATWVGPTEAKVGSKTYRVLLSK